MTVSEMQTDVARLLNDTGNDKWSASTAILPALNSAQEEFVVKILGFSGKNRKVFDILTELQASKSASISTTGYALSGVDSTPGPVMRNGVIAASATLDSVTRWLQIIDVVDLNKQRNYWFTGNDERPLGYVYGETFYILVSTGTYPVTTTIYYIRRPKELVASGASGYQVTTCELDAVYHRIINEMAAANCWRGIADESSMAKYNNIMKRVDERIAGIAMSGLKSEKMNIEEIK